MPAKRITPEMTQQVIELRMQNVTREEIASRLGIPLSRVKTILGTNKVVLPMEVRQRNAYENKLKKDPDAMSKMRSKIDIEYRSEKIREAYAGNERLAALQSESFKRWWSSLGEQDRAEFIERRSKAFDESEVVKAYQQRACPPGMSVEEHFASLVQEKGGTVVGSYSGSKDRVEVACGQGHTFMCSPADLKSHGAWCPSCIQKVSKPQLEIAEYIKGLCEYEVSVSDRSVISPKEIDIYVPQLRFGVEYHGLYWHCSAMDHYKETSSFHKWDACRQKDVRLVTIFQDEWLNKKDLVKSLIAVKMGVASVKKIAARKTVVDVAPPKAEVAQFFELNHMSGTAKYSAAIALRYEGEIVCCASFRTNFNSEFEMARFATKVGFVVQGGLSKILSKIPENISRVVSYSDNRFSDGDVYRKCGFENITRPGATNSYYYTDGNVRIWRFKCRRINEPEILEKFPTEEQQALGGVFAERILGVNKPLYRIDDAGHQKWLWTRT